MAVLKAISHKDGLYFITITCARWIKLFEITNGYDIIYKCPSDRNHPGGVRLPEIAGALHQWIRHHNLTTESLDE